MVMPKRVDPLERRRVIADAAITAIAATGLEGVKLSRIAQLARVTTGAVTHYFESKDDVLLAALERVAERLFARAGQGEAGSHATLAHLFETLPLDPQALAEWKVWLAFWGRAAFVPRLSAVHRACYEQIEIALAAWVGGDREVARLRAAAIIAAVDGVGVRAALEPDRWPAERQRRLLETLVLPLLASFSPEPLPHDRVQA